jgi:hypothetical protein
MMGHGLDVFLQDIARKCLRYGHVGVLVDFPRGDEGDETPATDFRRPYWVPYSPRNILGWKTDVIDGELKLTELRLYEELVVPYGAYGEEQVAQVRVLTPGAFELYRFQPSKSRDWELINEGQTNLDAIPFGIAYSQQTGILESSPPLEEIAWLNLQAYRCESDQSNILHVAAVPRYNLFGVPAEVEQVTSGPGTATAWPVDARAEFAAGDGENRTGEGQGIGRATGADGIQHGGITMSSPHATPAMSSNIQVVIEEAAMQAMIQKRETDLYEQLRAAVSEIAAQTDCSVPTVLGWLRIVASELESTIMENSDDGDGDDAEAQEEPIG